ncbi:AEC family transporter [Lacticaseibacillus thailandensis]|uniref:AEC family transporter n=1 Tax=Lacticaseibacillus thailandensis TaxID=381741 RepID=UPI0034E2D717
MLAGYQKIVTIILLIAIGFVLKKINVISPELQKGLNNFLIKFIIPFAVFAAFF